MDRRNFRIPLSSERGSYSMSMTPARVLPSGPPAQIYCSSNQ